MRNFTQEEAKVIYKDAKNKGLNPDKVMSELVLQGATFDGIDMNQARQFAESQIPQTEKPKTTFKEKIGEAFGDVKQVGTDIVQSSQKRADNISKIKSAMQSGEQGDVRSILQTTGELAGAGADAIGALAKGAANIFLSDKTEKAITQGLGEKAQQVIQIPEVQSIIKRYEALPEENKRDIDALGGVVSLITNFIGGEAVGAGTKAGVTAGKKVLDKGVDIASATIKETGESIAQTVPKAKDAFVSFVSPNIDDNVKNVLKNTPTEKFDEVVKIAEASADPTKPSTYEFVAKSMTDATKQIDNQVKSLSQQKNIIINKAKTGLTDFQKETGKVILDINRGLKDSELAKSFISRLKQVKTKIDADKAVDDLQDVLYKGNKDMTIPTGSKEDTVLKGILGKYNAQLKATLPSSYGKINTEISNRLKVLNELNRSLGQVVDGVSVRGAGLVKQFFSPAGTKTKQLFEYIKKTTGVDLAQDAVLAKYVGEAFGDTKIKSLLEGVPTTQSGVIDKVVDFTLEKTGASGALRKAKQEGMVKKARSLTLPKK